MTART
jgi:beta-mannosidase